MRTEEKEGCRKARARERKQLLMMGREIRDDREKAEAEERQKGRRKESEHGEGTNEIMIEVAKRRERVGKER